MASITSANAVLTLTIPGVYPTGIQIQQFAVDDAFVAEAIDTAEIQVGVDGYSAAGLTPREVPMSIFLLASSPSVVVFDNWNGAEWTTGDKIAAYGVIIHPSVGKKYALNQGFLHRWQPMAETRRVLQRREYRVTWTPNGLNSPAIQVAPA
ncbi:MAG: hypothetical protein KGO96_10610 [Elusimicrobia bacterium]|nr:hypothetical protein [Elusimicrobiota bacterium]